MAAIRALVDTLSDRRPAVRPGPTRWKLGIANRLVGFMAALVAAAMAYPGVARAQLPFGEELLSAVVKITTQVPAEARTARNLGTTREGGGIVIDGDGLVVTVGYLILESTSAEIELTDGRKVPAHYVAYDHETGLGLLRAAGRLGVKALEFGDSDMLRPHQQVLVAGSGGLAATIGAYVVSRRAFAGWWEYMLESAIFTAPPHPQFGGAALIDATGKLVGVGSLIVPDAAEENVAMPGNMFIPINMLKPILADLLAKGRSSQRPRPWLGLYAQEIRGRLFVNRVPAGGPAASAGVRPGDLVLAVADKPVTGLKDYYRKLWSVGSAGVEVPLTLLRGIEPTRITIRSIDRYDWFRLRPSY